MLIIFSILNNASGSEQSNDSDHRYDNDTSNRLNLSLTETKQQLQRLSKLEMTPRIHAEIDKLLQELIRFEEIIKNNANSNETWQASQNLMESALKKKNKVALIYKRSIEQGRHALDSGNPDIALQAFTYAAKFTHNLDEVNDNLKQVDLLTETRSFIVEGDAAKDVGKTKQAISAYQNALILMPNNDLAQAKLENLLRLEEKQRFENHMKSGNRYLYQEQYTQAISEFEKATAIEQDSEEAKAALSNAKQTAKTAQILQYLGHALAAEQQERWQDALHYYNKVLELDPTLEQAITGKRKAKANTNP